MKLTEDLLHFIWRYQLFKGPLYEVVSGKCIRIQHPGHANQQAGPDFLVASLHIGTIDWVGHVEIHIQSSDWYAHGHQQDRAYDNVILHVVWNNNKEVRYANGLLIPTLALQPYVDAQLLARYEQLQGLQQWIPCEKIVNSTVIHSRIGFLTGLAYERLLEKAEFLTKLLQQYQGDWEKVFFICLARSFGFQVNTEAFETLAHAISIPLLAKYRFDHLKIDALFFGQSGMLEGLEKEGADPYIHAIATEYTYLKKLHKLKEMPAHSWRFLRMRPFNFPSFRLAQLAGIYKEQQGIFSKLIQVQQVEHTAQQLLSNLYGILLPRNIADFWKFHFTFVKKAKVAHRVDLTTNSQRHLLINVVVPLTFTYGRVFNLPAYCEAALSLLDYLPAEKNKVTRAYLAVGFPCEFALESQALLYLKQQYCDKKRCLHCQIGFELLKTKHHGT